VSCRSRFAWFSCDYKSSGPDAGNFFGYGQDFLKAMRLSAAVGCCTVKFRLPAAGERSQPRSAHV